MNDRNLDCVCAYSQPHRWPFDQDRTIQILNYLKLNIQETPNAI